MSGVDCTFCVHPAETKCKRGLDCCQKCAVEVSPNMPDAVVSDLVRGRVLSADWHTPMRPEQVEQVRRSFDSLAGWPLEGLERLLKDGRGES